MLDKKFAFPYPSLQHGEQSVERLFFSLFPLNRKSSFSKLLKYSQREKNWKEENQTMEITKARWKHFLCVANW